MQNFYQQLLQKRSCIENLPSNTVIAQWALKLLDIIFPERSSTVKAHEIKDLENYFEDLKTELLALLEITSACKSFNHVAIVGEFFNNIPQLYRQMHTDVQAILKGDPAATSEFEIIRAYPGFFATALYRIANQLHLLKTPLIPRILTEYAHSQTGIDIHPGAVIGDYLYIDHGTGIVIGETSILGSHIKLYQGVTLGALSVEKSMANEKRHPDIQDHVIIYAGATILGGHTCIGHHSIIGGNVWLTNSIDPYSRVFHQATIKVETQNNAAL